VRTLFHDSVVVVVVSVVVVGCGIAVLTLSPLFPVVCLHDRAPWIREQEAKPEREVEVSRGAAHPARRRRRHKEGGREWGIKDS
jgi:hypothetical protein